MKYNELSIDLKEMIKLEEKLKLLPQKAEYEVNNYLWTDGGTTLQKEVYKRMPKSKYKKYGKPKTHAKESESLDLIRYNLGVKIQTKTSPKSKDFGYLIFPDEGRGKRQKNKGSQEFFRKSLESQKNKLIDGLIEHLDKKIEEEI